MLRRFCLPLVLVLAAGLSACGVKGPLEPPPHSPGAPQASAPAGASQAAPGVGSVANEVKQEGEAAWGANPRASYEDVPPDTPGDSISRPAPRGTGTPPPRQKFFLDFLL